MSWVWRLTKQTFAEAWEDNVPRLAASLAFYSMFSIAPILVIAIAIAGAVFGRDAAANAIAAQLQGIMGPTAAHAINAMVAAAGKEATGSTIATILGIIFLIYGSMSVFAELQDSMNTIWEVKPRPDISWWYFLQRRLLNFAMVLAVAFILLVSLIISATIAALSRFLTGTEGTMWHLIYAASSFILFTIIFAAMFKYLPDAKIKWRDVWLGAVVTSILLVIGKFLIGLYLARPSVTSVYGAAGSIAIMLIWIYYTSHILFLGCEFTQVYARRTRKKIQPDDMAVKLTENDRAQQGIPHQRTVEKATEAADVKKNPDRERDTRTKELRDPNSI